TWAGIACALAILMGFCRLAGATPPAVEAYGMLPVMEDAKLSPNGAALAFLSSVKGHRCLVVQSLEDNRNPVTICPGNMEVSWIAWKTDKRLLVGVYKSTGFYDRLITASFLLGIDADGSNIKELL